MALYLGRPGALTLLPSPRSGMRRDRARRSTVAQTIGGGQVVAFTPGGRRTYQPRWEVLTRAQYAVLERFYVGANGPGPYVLLDTQRRNHLAANQAATTSVDNDPGGFSVAAGSGEAVTSTPDTWRRGPRSLRWTLPGTVTSGVLDLDPPGGLVGVPTPDGVSWTFSGQLSCAGIAPSVTVTPVLSWRRWDGSEASTSSGTPVVAAIGGWTAFVVTGTVPAGCVALRAQLRVAPGVLTAAAIPGVSGVLMPLWAPRRPAGAAPSGRGEKALVGAPPRRPASGQVVLARAPIASTDVLVDELQLDLSATARDWTPGTGVPLVSMPALSEAPIWDGQLGPIEATFVEVG